MNELSSEDKTAEDDSFPSREKKYLKINYLQVFLFYYISLAFEVCRAAYLVTY
jgi:hypothetical protein